MPSPKYHTRIFRRTPLTLQYEMIREEFTQKKWDDTTYQSLGSDILVVENLSTHLLDFSCWDKNKDGEHFLAFQLLGIPFVTIDQCQPNCSISFRKGWQAWRPHDKFFYFTGDLSQADMGEILLTMYKQIRELEEELKAICGSSQIKEAERVALFPSFEAYRAFRLSKMYYIIYQLCAGYGLKVVYIPSHQHEFLYS